MKIAHVVQCYYPAIGGSEWLTQNFSEQLVARYGDQVTVFTSNAYKPETFYRAQGPRMQPGTETLNGVHVRRFKTFNGLKSLRGLLASAAGKLHLPYNDWLRTIQNGPLICGMSNAIAESQADVVFATSFPFMHMYYALAGAQKARIPIVFLGAIHVVDTWGYNRRMMFDAIQKADAYIAHTPVERDYLAAHHINPEKIHIIGGGVHADAFIHADGTEIRQQYGWGDDPVVGVVARQSESKRLDLLLKAMPKVWAKYPQAHLLLAGAKTSYAPRFEKLITDLKPEHCRQVTLINNFPETTKPQLLAACDIIAHPSAKESFGIAIIEAWASDKPVIGARLGAVQAVISEGQDGLLFDYPDSNSLAQAILILLENPAERKRMGNAGQKKVLKNYTWQIVTDRLRAVYKEVIEHHH